MIISQRTFVILILFGVSNVWCETNLKTGEQNTFCFLHFFLLLSFRFVTFSLRRRNFSHQFDWSLRPVERNLSEQQSHDCFHLISIIWLWMSDENPPKLSCFGRRKQALETIAPRKTNNNTKRERRS